MRHLLQSTPTYVGLPAAAVPPVGERMLPYPDSPKKAQWGRRRGPARVQKSLILLAVLLTAVTSLYMVHVQRALRRGGAADRVAAPRLRGSLSERDLPSHRLLLATHNRLMWYTPATDEVRLLHEGEVGWRMGEGGGVLRGRPLLHVSLAAACMGVMCHEHTT